jgi:dUTP pyrophosphatase
MIKDIVYFAKVKPDAIIPSKTEGNAGRDVYACFDEDNMVIQPHETKLIPLGIASICSPDYYFQFFGRGSTGVKGIGQGAGVVDSSFRGEWQLALTNHNNKPLLITKETNEDTLKILSEDYVVYPYSKAIVQFVVLPVPRITVNEITYDELIEHKTDRMFSMLGSSGK